MKDDKLNNDETKIWKGNKQEIFISLQLCTKKMIILQMKIATHQSLTT